MTPLRKALIDECKLRGYSERTRDSYLYAVTQLANYYHQSPDTVSDEQLEQYFRSLSLERRLSSATIHLALFGLTVVNSHSQFQPVAC
jgi:integrase/recombinase XerD